jgi:hypothetical protein
MSACSEEATEYHEQTCTVNDYQSDGEMEEEAPMEGAEDDWWADEDGAGAGVRAPPSLLVRSRLGLAWLGWLTLTLVGGGGA